MQRFWFCLAHLSLLVLFRLHIKASIRRTQSNNGPELRNPSLTEDAPRSLPEPTCVSRCDLCSQSSPHTSPDYKSDPPREVHLLSESYTANISWLSALPCTPMWEERHEDCFTFLNDDPIEEHNRSYAEAGNPSLERAANPRCPTSTSMPSFRIKLCLLTCLSSNTWATKLQRVCAKKCSSWPRPFPLLGSAKPRGRTLRIKYTNMGRSLHSARTLKIDRKESVPKV